MTAYLFERTLRLSSLPFALPPFSAFTMSNFPVDVSTFF